VADDAVAAELDHRHGVQFEAAVGECVAEAVQDGDAQGGVGVVALLVDGDAVAARVLGGVEGEVGVGEDGLPALPRLEPGDAGADRDAGGADAAGDGDGGDGVAEPVGDAHRGGLVGVEDDRELVAAEPAQDVALAEAVAQDVGERAHDPVARRVAAEVVDVLEVVEIEQQQRAVAEREPAFQFPGEGAAVEQSGQRILVGHSDEGFLPFITFSGVHRAVPPTADIAHPIEVTVVEPSAADLEPAVLIGAGSQRNDDAVGALALSWPLRRADQQSGQRTADALLGCERQELGHDTVRPAHTASCVGHGERRVGGVQHLTQ
jgi:hypothetical protein